MNTYRDDIYLAANGVIVSYQGAEKEIEIPSRLADSNIIQIGIGAFMDDENLREVIIPETVKVIREKAFFNDDNLRKMGKGSVSNVGTGGMATKIKYESKRA